MSQPVGRISGYRSKLAGAALGCASIGAALVPQTALADPVVQSLPVQSAGMKLNDALGLLARNPQDLEALIAAGRASLELGDVQAAIGFFHRAETLWPGSVRAKAGLAGAFVLGADPIAAISMFKDAEKFGPIDAARVADRGLAYDLVGDNQTAQAYYRQSLALTASDETSRRLALSQAISGDRRGMEATLGPLLQRQDKGAWRARAFALAILGVPDEAESRPQRAILASFRAPPKLVTTIRALLLTPARAWCWLRLLRRRCRAKTTARTRAKIRINRGTSRRTAISPRNWQWRPRCRCQARQSAASSTRYRRG